MSGWLTTVVDNRTLDLGGRLMPGLDLPGANALVTGASRGIGPHIAAALAKRGAKVAITARSERELSQVAEKLTNGGATVIAIAADITSSAQRRELVHRAEEKLGTIDVLIN